MHDRPDAAAVNGVGGAVKQVADHARTLMGLQAELAGLELKRKANDLGPGAALVAAAAVAGLFALGFVLAAVAVVLAKYMALWLALLIVAAALLLAAMFLAVAGRDRLKRGSPPVPEQALEEAKRTTEALKDDGGS